MIHLISDRRLEQPADRVWAVLSDYDRDPEWRRGVTTMAPSTRGPAVVGTTTDELLRTGGRTYRNGGIVDAVDPGRRIEWRTTSGVDAHGSRTVEPIGERACTVTLEVVVRPRGVERLLAPVLRRVLAKGLAGDLERLDALVAAGSSELSRR